MTILTRCVFPSKKTHRARKNVLKRILSHDVQRRRNGAKNVIWDIYKVDSPTKRETTGN